MDQETITKVKTGHKYGSPFIFCTSLYFTVVLLSRNRPTISLDNFYVSSLNKTACNDLLTETTTISFDLTIKNENSYVGVYYENPLDLTISYFPSTITKNTNLIIAKYPIQGFYQGNGKTKHVQVSVVVPDLFSKQGRKLGEISVPLMGPAKVESFKVDLDAKIKFRSIENKKSDLVAGTVVDVNGETGSSVLDKTFELKYDSGSNKWGIVQWLLVIPVLILLELIIRFALGIVGVVIVVVFLLVVAIMALVVNCFSGRAPVQE